jgi:hypothetical protein
MGLIPVITERFTFRRLMFLPKMTTAGFCTGQSIAAHQLTQLKKVSHSTRFLEALVKVIPRPRDSEVTPKLSPQLRNRVNAFL